MRTRLAGACVAALIFRAVGLPAQSPAPQTGALPAAQPGQVQSAPGQPALSPLTPEQQAEKQGLLRRARAASPALTTAAVNDRLDLWKMVTIIDPTDREAQVEYDRAQHDLDAARAQEATQAQQRSDSARAQATAAGERQRNIDAAQRNLADRKFDAADQNVGLVLAQSPDDPVALSLRDAIRQARDTRAFTRRMLIAAAVMLVLAVGIIVLLKRLGPRAGAAGAGGPKAVVKVVDGVGRGKLMPLEKEIFRIGAADGERPDEKNDLVISDSASLVSRYHCTILRRGRDYFLLDSSLNGTRLNGRRLARGEHHLLDDGDEFILADASRVKFLLT